MADTAIQLASLKKEASKLSARISFLYTESDLLRRKLAAEEAEDKSEEKVDQFETTLALVSNIIFLRQEIEAVRKDLVLDQQARRELEQEVQKFQALHQPAQNKLDRLLELEAQLPITSSLSAISEPALPTSPVSPRRTQNITMAGVLGVMLGVFAALFREFYRPTTLSLPPGGE